MPAAPAFRSPRESSEDLTLTQDPGLSSMTMSAGAFRIAVLAAGGAHASSRLPGLAGHAGGSRHLDRVRPRRADADRARARGDPRVRERRAQARCPCTNGAAPTSVMKSQPG